MPFSEEPPECAQGVNRSQSHRPYLPKALNFCCSGGRYSPSSNSTTAGKRYFTILIYVYIFFPLLDRISCIHVKLSLGCLKTLQSGPPQPPQAGTGRGCHLVAAASGTATRKPDCRTGENTPQPVLKTPFTI